MTHKRRHTVIREGEPEERSRNSGAFNFWFSSDLEDWIYGTYKKRKKLRELLQTL